MVEGGERGERPTLPPGFDLQEYARHSEELIAVEPVQLPPQRDRLRTVRAFSADTPQARPSVRARPPRARSIMVVAATLIGAISLLAHRAGSSQLAQASAAGPPSTVRAISEPRVVELATAPEVRSVVPPLASSRAEASPRAAAAPPSKAIAAPALPVRRRDPALERDAVLNPFE
jgi:hypothetical protein